MGVSAFGRANGAFGLAGGHAALRCALSIVMACAGARGLGSSMACLPGSWTDETPLFPRPRHDFGSRQPGRILAAAARLSRMLICGNSPQQVFSLPPVASTISVVWSSVGSCCRRSYGIDMRLSFDWAFFELTNVVPISSDPAGTSKAKKAVSARALP